MYKIILLFTTLILLTNTTNSVAQKQMKYEKLDISMFPVAEEGFKQVYIQLPILPNEENLKVEIYAGKTIDVDCNRHFMNGQIKEQDLQGWGYNFYTIESNGVIVSTKMGCLDNKTKKEFVTMPSNLVRYNSKLPIVIYIPLDMDIKYKVWKADNKLQNAKKSK